MTVNSDQPLEEWESRWEQSENSNLRELRRKKRVREGRNRNSKEYGQSEQTNSQNIILWDGFPARVLTSGID
jgi:hypothetical protein